MKLSPGMSVLSIRRWHQQISPYLFSFRFLPNGIYSLYTVHFGGAGTQKEKRRDYTQYLNVTKRNRASSSWMGSSAQPFSDLSREVWALDGPIKDFHRDVLKPLGSVLRVSVGSVWGQECSGAGFLPGCLYITAFNFSLKVSCWPKTSPWHDAVTIMLHCRDGTGLVMSQACWWPQAFRQKRSIFVSPDQRIWSLREWLTGHTSLIGGVLPCVLCPHSNARALLKWPPVSWLPPWLRNFIAFAQIGWASTRKGPCGSRILPFMVTLPQICASGFGGSQTVLWRALSPVGPYIKRCLFQNHVQSDFITGGL